ncbi:MAG: OmpH family outer membrane protein [Flavobacteriales bacterium]
MKKVFLLLAIICATGISSFSQQQKTGHINGSALIKHMPEYKTALTSLEQKQDELLAVIQSMSSELDSLQIEREKNLQTWAPIVRNMKEDKIRQLNSSLQTFQQQAQEQLQIDEQTLMNPILYKANQSIEKVAKANGYTYIIDSSAGSFLYLGGDDITALVCADLGIPDFTAELKAEEEKAKALMSGQKPVPTPGPGTGGAPGMTPKKP